MYLSDLSISTKIPCISLNNVIENRVLPYYLVKEQNTLGTSMLWEQVQVEPRWFFFVYYQPMKRSRIWRLQPITDVVPKLDYTVSQTVTIGFQ